MKLSFQKRKPLALAVATAIAMSCSSQAVLAQDDEVEEETRTSQAGPFVEQLGAYVTTEIDSGGGTTNVGDVKIQAFEGALRASFGNFNLSGSLGYVDSELNGVSTYEDTALPDWDTVFPGVGDDLPIGDSTKGCVTSATQNCFDFSPFAQLINGAEQLNTPQLGYNLSYVTNAGNTLLYGDQRTAGVRARMTF